MGRQAYAHRQHGIGVTGLAYPHKPISEINQVNVSLDATIESKQNGTRFLKAFQGRAGKSIAAGLALAYSLALAPPLYANENEPKETETAVSVTEASKPAIITYLRFNITDPNLPEQKFDPEYNPRPVSNSTSIVWGIKPQKVTLSNIVRHADEPFTRLFFDRYHMDYSKTIDEILCGSGGEEDFGKMYYALKAAGMHTKEKIVLASDLYIAGCITRDQFEISRVFDAMAPGQKASLLDQIHVELQGNVGRYNIKPTLDRGFSPTIDKYILKAFDWIYRAAMVRLIAGAFSHGRGHAKSSSDSTNSSTTATTNTATTTTTTTSTATTTTSTPPPAPPPAPH